MRLPWLALCCILSTVTCVQAESYPNRDRDDGFNPLNVMRDMPSPMSMFDSSDNHRKRHRRPPPPPFHRPPPPAFPAPGAAYAPPPYSAPAMPYRPYQPAAPTTTRPIVQQPAVTPVPAPRATIPAPAPYTQVPRSDYSYRPTPEPADAGSMPEAAASQSEPTPPQEKAPEHKQHEPGETVMVDGKPVIFRPMNLGVDEKSE